MKRDVIERIREELVGRYFSNKSELRHIAERAGFTFVPVEFLSEDDHEAVVALRPEEVGEIRVRAVRPVSWQPFYITAVEPA